MECWSFVNGGWRPGDLAFAERRWFDLTGSPNGELEALGERFGLHHLAIEDCLSPLLHAPKVDEFPDYLFAVVQAVVGGGPDPLEELDVFAGRNLLITYHDGPIPEIAAVHDLLGAGRVVREGIDGLFYEICDRVVDGILPEVDRFAGDLERLHDEALDRPGTGEAAHAVTTLRARAGHLRRMLAPQMAVFQRMSRGEYALVTEPNRIYFRDIYDHLVRVDLALEGVREDAEVVLNTYLSSLNNRLSEVMKVLSVVAALALPGTLISGIFGTNFDNVPGLHSNWGFALMMASIGGIAGGMGLYFRRRGWW